MMIHDHLGPFARHLMAYCLSEVAAKASRLLVVVAVARTMDATAIGVAAAALAAADILKALTENGVGQRIISARPDALEATCRTARRIFNVWCFGLFGLQIMLGGVLFAINGDWATFILIAVLAGEYIFMPAGLVQCALAMREGRLQETAAIAAGQVVGANAMSAILAVLVPGPLALVLPRLLAAPIWLLAMRRLRPWTPDRNVRPADLRPFVSYGMSVLGVEVSKALRLQADKLVIVALLGTEALGIYFMAFNAGLGLATSFAQAFSVALFPHLCAAADPAAAMRRALGLSLGVIAPVVIAQAMAAPFYVPILFGDAWQGIDSIVSVLCLAAIPGVLWSGAAQWLRAQGQPQIELMMTLGMTLALIANTVLLARYGLTSIAFGYLAVAIVTQTSAALYVLAPAFRITRQEAF